MESDGTTPRKASVFVGDPDEVIPVTREMLQDIYEVGLIDGVTGKPFDEVCVDVAEGCGMGFDMNGGLRVSLDEGAFPPVRSHDADAGIDLRAMEGTVVPAHGSEVVRTGTHVEVPRGFAGLLVSRSGLNVRRGVTTTGLVDSGYTGEVVVRMHNDSDRDYLVGPGDRVTQLVVIPCVTGPVTVVDEIEGGERGDAGFGSTGR